MSTFKDNFSGHSNIYVKYRPQYPIELFEFLNTMVSNFDLAWDCGTGNGQSAICLANYFTTVYATDPSEAQIKNAVSHDRVIYKVEPAEHSGLKNNTVDLVTVAQALHWFNIDKFFTEAKRVLKINGIIAVWTYGVPSVSPLIDKLINHFHDDKVGSFWQHENRLAAKGYSTIPFPFPELPGRDFKIQKEMTLNEFIGHVKSWSATQRFIEKNGFDPTTELKEALLILWSDNENKKEITWELRMKVGINSKG